MFQRIENVFRRLENYIEYPRTTGMIDAIVKVMVEVLCIIAIATKEIKENRTSELILANKMSICLVLFRKVSEEAGGKDGYRGCAAEA